jgi:mono/diheme cytochrome c family protein
VTVENAQPVSLADIQVQVFGPRCSVCHSGPSGGGLPSGLDLSSAANSHANLVNVMSLQTTFDRVEPGNPDDSYLIRKLEGGPGIVGSQMPQGGPFLDQATINTIRQWITEGAQNN